jgi:hypothetical protein
MSPGAQLAALCGLAIVLIAVAVRIALRVVQGNPEKRERRRRLEVHRHGRLGEALITEGDETTLYYTYSVHGVEYSASQDIATLRDRLPAEPGRLVGVARLKYAPRNPANSILLCEEWSGLRAPGATTRLGMNTAQDRA